MEDEKEEALQDVRRLEENLTFQRNLHKQLESKDSDSRAAIKNLGQQLGTLYNFIYTLCRRCTVPTPECSPSEKRYLRLFTEHLQ